MIRNSIRQLRRTPLKTALFLLLIIATGMLLSLGCSLWVMNNRNIDYYENSFVTIGTVEQKLESIAQVEQWDIIYKDYVIFPRAVYGEVLPSSVLDYKGAGYLEKPEKRPFYGSYSPEYKIEKPFSPCSVIEVVPVEDGTPNQPVEVQVTKVLYGDYVVKGQTIEIYDETLEDPKPMDQGKTYVLCVLYLPIMEGDQFGHQFCPISAIVSRQYHPDGTRIPPTPEDDSLYYEVTEGFYETETGERYLEYVKSLDQYFHALPVTGTNSTILLMPFYDKDAYILQGRDITEDEYEKGEKVCLLPRKFAKDNNLTVGDTIHLQLYFADYRSAASEVFDNSVCAEINAEGKAYPVFEDSRYTVVGIYDMTSGAGNGNFGLAKDEVIIPSKSITNSDSNNIMSFGPMKSNTTSFRIPNGTIEEFMKAWGKSGYDNLEIKFYDRGYSKLKAGIDNMKNMSLALIAVGFVMVISILLFFSHILITKQIKRTAIESSLGMGRRECRVSLLTGILVILILGGALGSTLGGVLSLKLSGNSAEISHYDTMYSSGMADDLMDQNTRDKEEDIPVIILISALSMSLIVLMGTVISLYKINANLKCEPMELLSRQKE